MYGMSNGWETMKNVQYTRKWENEIEFFSGRMRLSRAHCVYLCLHARKILKYGGKHNVQTKKAKSLLMPK